MQRAALAANPFLRDLAEQYGAVRVWRVAEETLGFPATIVSTMNEAAQVAAALEKGA